nr:hypothetical protein [Tanacetum cinerariifolium]
AGASSDYARFSLLQAGRMANYNMHSPGMVLNNWRYAPSVTRGVISVSRLYEDGFINCFVNNTIQVSRNNMVYFSAILKDGIFEIDLSNSYTNKSSIYSISNKRAKLDLDSALLWHCRLGHISKKRIEKLQHDGLLYSSYLRPFEKCVSYMSGKMSRKPYTHQVKRAKDLHGLIHANICGPFKIMSRQGASYFVTFTDDFSRYGYIYLLKHKHEVFETFKVFQKEVENTLGKTIKSLRSDRGGEYMSQEFLDHLKDHGIIAHCTPPYTPQHNGVSERRNRTLLDMIRSMMSQTTLPKSFWDYALETAARILNMVLNKKRDTLNNPEKLKPRSIKCIFIGYPKETMGYSFYYTPENKVLVSRNTEFLENSLINQKASGSLKYFKIILEDTHPSIDTSLNHKEDDQEINEPQSDIVLIRRSTRIRHASDRMCLYINVVEHELGDLGELANYKAALLDPESEKCLNATNVEMQSMKDNKNVTSRFPKDLGDLHWTTVKSILKYLKNTKDILDMCSFSMVVLLIRRVPSKAYSLLYHLEAEYIAAFDASKEVVWVRKFISGLSVVPTIKEPISMYYDNTRAIAIANESEITKGVRHFCAKVHYLREVIEYGDIKLEKVHTYDNLADPFTKALAFLKHLEHTRNIGMLPASSLM